MAIPTNLTDRQIANLKSKFDKDETITFYSGLIYDGTSKSETFNIHELLDGDNMNHKIQIWRKARSEQRSVSKRARKDKQNAWYEANKDRLSNWTKTHCWTCNKYVAPFQSQRGFNGEVFCNMECLKNYHGL